MKTGFSKEPSTSTILIAVSSQLVSMAKMVLEEASLFIGKNGKIYRHSKGNLSSNYDHESVSITPKTRPLPKVDSYPFARAP